VDIELKKSKLYQPHLFHSVGIITTTYQNRYMPL
jgi:hypothetical protein